MSAMKCRPLTQRGRQRGGYPGELEQVGKVALELGCNRQTHLLIGLQCAGHSQVARGMRNRRDLLETLKDWAHLPAKKLAEA